MFGVVYGFFAGRFVSTNVGLIKMMRQRHENADIDVLLGIISAARGIGAIASGPLSDSVLSGKSWEGIGAHGIGYGGLIVLTGVSAAAGGLRSPGKRLR